MTTVILVDDEKIIRLGLRKMIEDNCPDIEVVGEAENGRDALALTLALDPDLCIVDMRMPYMSGMEYIAQARSCGCRSKIVILSGYADFSYAQQALEHGCSGYLLKPVKIERLTELLRELCAEVYAGKAAVRGPTAQTRERAFVHERTYWAAIVRLEGGPDHTPALNAVAEQLARTLRMQSGLGVHLTPLDAGVLYLLLAPADGSQQSGEQACGALRQAHQALLEAGMPVTMGVSGPFVGEEQLPESQRQCAEAASRRFYEGTGGFFLYRADAFNDNEPAFQREEKQFLNAMQVGDAAAREALREIFDLMRAAHTRKSVCVVVFSQLYMKCGSDAAARPTFAEVAEQLEQIDTFDEMAGYMQALFLQRLDALQKQNGAAMRIVRNAMRYVEKNYHTPLTVNEVAASLGLSVSYFSTLFRRETGEKFITYLIQYKVDKACELLDQSNLRIWEISQALGYTDVKYFCKIFRKYKGCTPSEYRAHVK